MNKIKEIIMFLENTSQADFNSGLAENILKEKMNKLAPNDEVTDLQIISLIFHNSFNEKMIGKLCRTYKNYVLNKDFTNEFNTYIRKKLDIEKIDFAMFSKIERRSVSEIVNEGVAKSMKEINLINKKVCSLYLSDLKDFLDIQDVVSYKNNMDKILNIIESKNIKSNKEYIYSIKEKNKSLSYFIDTEFKQEKLELMEKIKSMQNGVLYIPPLNIGNKYKKAYDLPIIAKGLFEDLKQNINLCLENKDLFGEEELLIIGIIKNKRLDQIVTSYMELKEEEDIVNHNGEKPEELLIKGITNLSDVISRYTEKVTEGLKNKTTVGI